MNILGKEKHFEDSGVCFQIVYTLEKLEGDAF